MEGQKKHNLMMVRYLKERTSYQKWRIKKGAELEYEWNVRKEGLGRDRRKEGRKEGVL